MENMEEFDMSKPGSELFPETSPAQYNSYTDEMVQGHDVGDPLDTGAQQGIPEEKVSDQQVNFKALREEVAKMKEEREYWKGQAEALTKTRPTQEEQITQQDPYSALDWDDSQDVRKAFNSMRDENQRLRREFQDALTAMDTKARRQDWESMVTQNIPELTNKNPIFAEMIKNASNPYEAAYLLAELNAKSAAPQHQNMNGVRAVANASKPQTLDSIGGQGKLSSADYYASMSDDDFMKVASKNLANI